MIYWHSDARGRYRIEWRRSSEAWKRLGVAGYKPSHGDRHEVLANCTNAWPNYEWRVISYYAATAISV